MHQLTVLRHPFFTRVKEERQVNFRSPLRDMFDMFRFNSVPASASELVGNQQEPEEYVGQGPTRWNTKQKKPANSNEKDWDRTLFPANWTAAVSETKWRLRKTPGSILQSFAAELHGDEDARSFPTYWSTPTSLTLLSCAQQTVACPSWKSIVLPATKELLRTAPSSPAPIHPSRTLNRSEYQPNSNSRSLALFWHEYRAFNLFFFWKIAHF